MRSPRCGRTYRRRVAVVLLIAMAGFLLPGCGGGGGQEPPPQVQDAMASAVADGGEGCAVVVGAGGGAWNETTTLTVPANASELVVASVAGCANDDLTGVTVTLTSPDGNRAITLQEGATSCTGFTERDLSNPATDSYLEDYFGDLFEGVPEDAPIADLLDLKQRMADDLPVSQDVLEGIEDYRQATSGYQNTIAQVSEKPGPTNGIVVLGPEAGAWTLEVTRAAGAGEFTCLAWACPAGGELDAIRNVARALAATGVTPAAVRPQADCTGCDPGCTERIREFRYPAPGTPEHYRSISLNVLYELVSWLVLRGLFTKAIDQMLKLAKWQPLIKFGYTFDKLKLDSIYVCSRIWREALRMEWIAEEAFWRHAFNIWGRENYTTICFVGVRTGPVTADWEPTITLGWGASRTITLAAGNAGKDLLPPEFWGRWSSSQPRYGASWEIDPAVGLATLRLLGEQYERCEIEIYDDPLVNSGNLTVMIANQPAKGVWPVEVGAVYWLSGAADSNVGFGVDDNLDVFLTHDGSTTQIVNTGTGFAGTKGPFSFEGHQGDVLKFQVRDTWGGCSALHPVYLRRGDTHSALAAPGFDEGCGHGGGDRGIRYTYEFTIPF